jgi:hypothetical protein
MHWMKLARQHSCLGGRRKWKRAEGPAVLRALSSISTQRECGPWRTACHAIVKSHLREDRCCKRSPREKICPGTKAGALIFDLAR